MIKSNNNVSLRVTYVNMALMTWAATSRSEIEHQEKVHPETVQFYANNMYHKDLYKYVILKLLNTKP